MVTMVEMVAVYAVSYLHLLSLRMNLHSYHYSLLINIGNIITIKSPNNFSSLSFFRSIRRKRDLRLRARLRPICRMTWKCLENNNIQWRNRGFPNEVSVAVKENGASVAHILFAGPTTKGASTALSACKA